MTTKKQSGWSRESRHKRGYGTAWDKVREQVLKRDKLLCQECLRSGRYRQADHVDHITPKARGGADELANLQSLCSACHRAKTDSETGRRRKHAVGLDGMPTDPSHHWNR